MNETERFFTECVKKGLKTEYVENVPNDIDYKLLYKIIIKQAMSVAVYSSLKCVKDKMPLSFVKAIEKSSQKDIIFDTRMSFDCDRLIKALEKYQVKFIPLKGFILKKLYPNSFLRFASDIDVLIYEKDFCKIKDVAKYLNMEFVSSGDHHDDYRFSDSKITCEFHKNILEGCRNSYFENIFEKSKDAENFTFQKKLDDEDFYITFIAHTAYHFSYAGGVGLRQVADVYFYTRNKVFNEEKLQKCLKESGLEKFSLQFEKVAKYLFEDDKPSEFTLQLLDYMVSSSVLSNEDYRLTASISYNMDSDCKKAINKTFFEKIFPPFYFMKSCYPFLKKFPFLLPFTYVFRWVKVIFTRPKNIKMLKEIRKTDENSLKNLKKIRDGLGINEF